MESLKFGSEGPAVRFLQVLLKGLECNHQNIIPDGKFGQQTALGVRELQERFGLPKTGEFWGPEHEKLNEAMGGYVDFHGLVQNPK